MVRCIGYRPFIYQKKVHNALNTAYKSGRLYVIKAKRQCGKSVLAENEALRFAINYKNTVSCIVEPTLNNARKVFKEIVKAIGDSSILVRKNETLLELEFINGSQILFKSAEQKDNLRGFTVSGILIIDEAAYINDEIFEILLPTTDAHNAPILLISTPNFKLGFFYEYFAKGFNPQFKDTVVSFDWALEDTSALLSKEKLEFYRKTVSANKFLTEYLGEFSDSNGTLFRNITNCINNNIKEYEEVYVGIDWATGNGNDDTAITVLNEKGQMVGLKYFNDLSPSDQITFIYNYLSQFKNINKILVEQNSIGSVFFDLLKKKFGNNNKIQSFTTTNKSKEKLVNKLQVALENNEITIWQDSKLLTELRVYEGTYNPKTGNTYYNAPNGMNDDLVISLMLAYEALKGNKNFYRLS